MFFIILFSSGLNAQNRWVKQYYSEKDALGLNLSIAYDNGYIVVGKHGHNYSTYNWLIKTDINGEILWEKTFGDPSTFIMFQDMAYNNLGDLYLTGSTGYYDEVSYDPLIMKLNACGEKQWCRVFTEADNNFSNKLVVTPDEGVVVILRYMNALPFIDRICLAKFDLDGNLQWKQCYNSSDTLLYNEDAYDITITPDGGFLITGYCAYEDLNPPHYWRDKPYYIKTDSLGNFEWEVIVHKEVSDIGGIAWNTVLSPDKNFYYSSLSHYYFDLKGDSPALLKMDINGDVVNIYDLASLNEYGKMIQAKFISDTTLMASAIWGNELIGGPKAIIIDTIGNILQEADLLENDMLAATEVTFDNKLLFFTNINNGDPKFDAYLFKLNQQLEADTLYNQWFNYDSLCPYPIASDTIVQDNCILIVGMEEITDKTTTNEKEILIYPNPATISFNIQSSIFETKETIVELFDSYGKKVKVLKVPKGQKEYTIFIEGWTPGLYIVKVWNTSGFLCSEQLIVK